MGDVQKLIALLCCFFIVLFLNFFAQFCCVLILVLIKPQILVCLFLQLIFYSSLFFCFQMIIAISNVFNSVQLQIAFFATFWNNVVYVRKQLIYVWSCERKIAAFNLYFSTFYIYLFSLNVGNLGLLYHQSVIKLMSNEGTWIFFRIMKSAVRNALWVIQWYSIVSVYIASNSKKSWIFERNPEAIYHNPCYLLYCEAK